MGVLGLLIFWWTIGAATIAASRMARSEDARLALLATVALTTIICYLGQGWLDQGIASLRIAALVGVLIGAVEAARALVPSPAVERTPRLRASSRDGAWQQVPTPAFLPIRPARDEHAALDQTDLGES
jgi:hypothetical protein